MINAAPYALMILSGFAGLGYEMVWVRSLCAGLGHEIISVLSVTSAFFVGTAAGAWLLDRPIRTSARPTRWYAALEIAIALWAIALTGLVPKLAPAAARLMGIAPPAALHWGVSFFLPLLLLLPATMAMGATLPAMDCIAVRLCRKNRLVGGLYGANTLGAVAGTLAATFWLVPAAGFGHTQYLLASANLVCALCALGIGRTMDAATSAASDRQPSKDRAPNRLIGTLFLTGLLGIGFEVLTVRILSQVLENTVFSYAVLLSIYLLGTASGAALYQARLAERPFRQTFSVLLVAQALSCTMSTWMLHFSPEFYSVIKQAGLRAGEIGLAVAVFFIPTAVMGATFSHLTQGLKNKIGALGPALTVNTLGAALAPFLFGIVLLPAWGPALSLSTVITGYLSLLPEIHRRIHWPAIGTLAAAGLIFALPAAFDFNRSVPGETAIVNLHGIMADVSIVRDSGGDLHLKVNNHYQMGGTASGYSDRRQAYLPLMLHPAPKTALFLGLGTGTTFSAAAGYPDLLVDGVELIPDLLPLMDYFTPPGESTLGMERRRVFAADARRFVLARHRTYDVIVADLFHPSRDGAGFLYTREHFSAVRSCLSEDGIFCQWLPLYQMDLDLLRLIMRTFLDVFPQGSAFIAHHSLTQPIIGLIGARSPLFVDSGAFTQTLARHGDLAERLRSIGLSSIYTLLGGYLADHHQLSEFAGDGPLNTDDRPLVVFSAPAFVYHAQGPSSPASRLMAIVHALAPRADAILGPASPAEERTRLSAYWQARDAYLDAGARAPRYQAADDFVREVAGPLLAVVRTSPDFEAAYRPLLIMADRLHRSDPQMAERLLADLEAATPQRPETAQLRRQWRYGG